MKHRIFLTIVPYSNYLHAGDGLCVFESFIKHILETKRLHAAHWLQPSKHNLESGA